MILVDESEAVEKILALSSALADLVVDSKEDKQISGNGEGVKRKEVKEKDVSEVMIPIDETKKK